MRIAFIGLGRMGWHLAEVADKIATAVANVAGPPAASLRLVLDMLFPDEAGKQALLGLFDEAHARGAALVVATHELGFVTRADRLIALADGEVRYDGAPGDTDVHALVFHA